MATMLPSKVGSFVGDGDYAYIRVTKHPWLEKKSRKWIKSKHQNTQVYQASY